MEINLHLHGTDTGNCRDIYSFHLDGKVLFVCRVPAPEKDHVIYYTMPAGKGEPDSNVKAGITFIHPDGTRETTGEGAMAPKNINFTWEVKS